jgi:hypothetical protein
MDKVMAKANTLDKADWQKKQVAIALSEMEARSKQAILLEMEKKRTRDKTWHRKTQDWIGINQPRKHGKH